ncbi:SDR family oxidoreductase [Geoalkalibacter halelectricus]|uniref:SDR family oxidoreductase n=1 Tax=Geoalkalibacter halelectricus TaxID=2847045 RepID=A0ABY5ZGN9_9BACT|nr:SDR family oxidoreductase [Geoalkalibacter halelectricus]MDO3378196.1 SDR family oxidoreductase [Geoalkalibacter halelectricus]UWZ78039.1 SDR family oxidoreductase [Geoalkalibacter halelectricus]
MSRTVFISGASSGFGAACARAFARKGDRLVLAARRAARLDTFAEELRDQARVYPLVLDLRERAAVEKALASLPAEFAEVDVLINNAGLALGLEPAHQTDLDDWDTMVDTNIKALMYCTRLLLPGMVERKRGHVINVSSTAGDWPYPGGNVYGGTKAFVNQFTRNLRADLLGTGVRASCVAPGMAETEFSQVRFKGDAARADQVYADTRPLTAEDVAEIILWIADTPPHVNVNSLEVMSVDQAWGHLAVHRHRGS